MTGEKIAAQGAVTFWISQPSPYATFRRVVTDLGNGACVPNPRTDKSALECAVRETYGSKNKIVQSRKKPGKHGIELVDVERNEDRNYYTTNFGAKVANGQVVTDYGYANRDVLQEKFDEEKATLTSAAVSKTLTAILEKLQGSRSLKPTGGVYFLPPDSIRDWRRIAEAIEDLGGTKVITVEVEMDPSLSSVVMATLREEVMVEALQMLDDLGRNTLSDAQVASRQTRAEALLEKVGVYESALERDLTDLRNAATLAKEAAMTAAIRQMPAVTV
jgi:hypothetical protein